MMYDRKLPKGHIGLTRRSWGWIRQGLRRCQESPDDRRRCLEWCEKHPSYTATWAEILRGEHPGMVKLVFEVEDYFDLPPEAMRWWERIIQNHPFAVLFAEERHRELLDLLVSMSVAGAPEDLGRVMSSIHGLDRIFDGQQKGQVEVSDLGELLEEYVVQHPEDQERARKNWNIIQYKLADACRKDHSI